MKKTIFYHNTDCGGVVYYAEYLKFFEEARTEFFNARGAGLKALEDQDTLFVVSRQEIDYHKPALYGQTLEIETELNAVTGVRLEFLHKVKAPGDVLLCCAKTLLVCVDKTIRPKPIPQDLREKLSSK